MDMLQGSIQLQFCDGAENPCRTGPLPLFFPYATGEVYGGPGCEERPQPRCSELEPSFRARLYDAGGGIHLRARSLGLHMVQLH